MQIIEMMRLSLRDNKRTTPVLCLLICLPEEIARLYRDDAHQIDVEIEVDFAPH